MSSVQVPEVQIVTTPLPELLASQDFIPQAVVNRPVRAFGDFFHSAPVRDHDDFDEYEGLAFRIRSIPVTIMHYEGHPVGTSTFYFPRSISGVDEISSLLREIFSHLNVPDTELLWQRRDDPEL
jgi:hypothetical protein